MIKKIRKLIKSIFQNYGFEIIKTDQYERYKSDSMDYALFRLNKAFPEIDNIVDVGAAKGTWTKLALNYWPESQYYLIEPLKEREPDLRLLSKNNSKIEYILTAIGEENRRKQFSVSDDLDGSGFYDEGKYRQVEVRTLDSIAKEFNLNGSVGIKLDTHGFEMPILNGAKSVLNNTEFLIIEVYGFKISPTAKLFWEISQHLNSEGFRLYDIVEVVRRKKDNAFWQADAVFIKKNHPVFSDNQYL